MVPETVLYNTHIMDYNIGLEIGTIIFRIPKEIGICLLLVDYI